jgi:hypothetical protein
MWSLLTTVIESESLELLSFFLENHLLFFWGHSEGSLFLELKYADPLDADLGWINCPTVNVNEMCPTIQALPGHTYIHTYTHRCTDNMPKTTFS